MTSTTPAASLAALMNPQSVAVIGASEDQTKFGGRLYKTLIRHGYKGTIYPINPGRESLFGIKTFPDITAIPNAPDMVVMALPTGKIKDEIKKCAEKGVKCSIIITSKFSDAGPEGAALEQEIVEIANKHNMRLIGPNCLGLISPANELVLCSSPALNVDALIKSPIGFISQSGALMGTLFDKAHSQGIGFSHCFSIGNQADLELCDFLEMLIHDDGTSIICAYIEGLKSPQRFIELAKLARQKNKPILAVKAGKTEIGSKAAFSHTASLAGDYASLKAICKSQNIILMDDPMAMFLLALSMSKFPGQKIGNATIITTSGGGGALTADALSEQNIPFSEFCTQTKESLAGLFTPGQAFNPIDLGGRRHDVLDTDKISELTAEIVMKDENVDAGLFVLTTAPSVLNTTTSLVTGAERTSKPFIVVMLPGQAANAARGYLVAKNIPFTNTLGEAVAALKNWQEWSGFKASPAVIWPDDLPDISQVKGILNESESKRLMASFGIPVNKEIVVADIAAAVNAASEIGFPMVAKVVSSQIVHKSDVGGVILNIQSVKELEQRLMIMLSNINKTLPGAKIEGFSLQSMESGELELIVGARNDAQFGPQVIIGSGGILVELLKDTLVLPAPVHVETAKQALEELKIAPLLKTYRGRPALDVETVAQTIHRLSLLACRLKNSNFEIEINPLKVKQQGSGCVAVDARAQIN
ncbi:acetate--CoA ligase family protein [Advenella sp. WQ 585]|uniref:Acetate--CoA ligase family protein n=1 Tax=Advenella mandrilli TaxID=2800330 RepID=A0ABS1EEZ3_9BURK|nr:acetate--CoA ligase family protein [Advenella mandrilli]MBK1780205.1 acetate--CoA ligase family protein [Advenella mandrilli]